MWRAGHIHYIWPDSFFKILDFFSYVTFKMGESWSVSVTCSSFDREWKMQQFKDFLDFFMEKCYNKLVIILWYLDLGTAVFKHLFFWVRPQWRLLRILVEKDPSAIFLWHCRQERYLTNAVKPLNSVFASVVIKRSSYSV